MDNTRLLCIYCLFLMTWVFCCKSRVLAKGSQIDTSFAEGWKQWTCDELTPSLCTDLTVESGYIDVPGRPEINLKYWRYSRLEEGIKVPSYSSYPILALHGGPGWPHAYMLPLKQQACRGRDIIFYDQGGCGESAKDNKRHGQSTISPKLSPARHPFLLDPTYYSEEELPAVIRHLGLDAEGFHLLGHSWGTLLAQLFVLNSNQTIGLQSIILSGPFSDSQSYIQAQWDENEGNLGSMVPPFIKERIRQLEAAKLFDSPEYQAIADTLTNFFTLRTAPWPDCVANSAKGLNKDIYVGMQGASEFTIGGTIASVNLTDRLHEISVPVLLTSGKFDTMRPSVVETMHKNIRFSEKAIFNQSGHISMIDQPGEMNDKIHDFLSKVESSAVVFRAEPEFAGMSTQAWNESTKEDDASRQKESHGSAQTLSLSQEWSKCVVAIVASFLGGFALGSKMLEQKKLERAKNGYTTIS